MPRVHPLSSKLRSALLKAAGEEGLITESDRLLVYEADALTTARGAALAVVLPPSRQALVEVLQALHDAGVPFVPRGAGTGLAGGAVASDAVIVCTARMNRILSVDPVTRTAVVEPGVVTAGISAAGVLHGLRYLPDPASATACTIGGNVAMNAGGPHCLRHGVTSDHIRALEVVLPDGRTARLGRGEDGGLDLAGLFIGSEGTLGMVSRIEVQLAPEVPAVGTLLALFDDIGAAGQAVTDVLARGILPVALEIIDRETIAVVEASAYAAGLPTDSAAALVLETEGEPEEVDFDLPVAEDIVRRAGARKVHRARNEVERTAIWQARKKAYGALGRLAPDVLVQDAVVPRTALADILPAIEGVAHKHRLRLASFFHAGDGNLHPNLLFDRRDPEEVRRVETASREIMQFCVDAGGTITGEHGVGLDKVAYMPMVFGPPELAVQRRIKEAMDPAGLCNPGKLLPPATLSREPEHGLRDVRTESESSTVKAGWLFPRHPDEIAAWLRALPRSAAPIITGCPPDGGEAADLARDLPLIGTGELDSVIAYRPRDLTITVGAGMRVERLQEIVSAEGQWLPIEGPGERRSVGGLVATAPPGALDTAFGPVRRQVLACRVVSPTGLDLRWGRPVVKNVAGYDLVRLCAGSRGRLGVLTEVTLRLWPRPIARCEYRLLGAPGLADLAYRLAGKDGPEPTAVSWTWSPDRGEQLRATVLGSEATMEARSRTLRSWASSRRLGIERADDVATIRPDPRALATAVFRIHAGGDYVCHVLRRLQETRPAELVRLVAWPRAGVGWIEMKTSMPAHRRAAPDWLSSPLLSESGIRVAVERGGPAEHDVSASRRDPREAEVERRLSANLAAWNRNWMADFL